MRVTCLLLASALVACGGSSGKAHDGGVDGAAAIDAGLPVDGGVAGPCPAPASAHVYYVCDCGAGADPDCKPGDDGAAGTSPAAAWQSFGQAATQFATLAPGDAIAFCRGGSIADDTSLGWRWVNPACRAGTPCVVRDYAPPWGSGDEHAPIIQVVGTGNAFGLDDPDPADHEEGYDFLHLDVRGGASGQFGFFVFNDVDDVLLCDVEVSGFTAGVDVGGSNAPAAGSDGKNERITLEASRIHDNRNQGWLGACDGCTIEDSTFEANGDAATLDHAIDLTSPTLATGVRVAGNTLHHSALVGDACESAALTAHGLVDDLTIEGNTITEEAAGSGCAGITVDTGGLSTPEGFHRAVVRGNLVVGMGNVAIGANACAGCTIEDNVIVADQAIAAEAISLPDRDRATKDLAMSDDTVRSNSILVTSSGTGIRLEGEGTGHVIVSNAIEYLGSSTAWTCFRAGLATTSYAARDHNDCYANGHGEWELGKGSLTAWMSSGFDTHSLASDPKFTSTTAPYDLSAGAGSPLVDQGDPTRSSPTAYGGAARDAMPDIGAYER